MRIEQFCVPPELFNEFVEIITINKIPNRIVAIDKDKNLYLNLDTENIGINTAGELIGWVILNRNRLTNANQVGKRQKEYLDALFPSKNKETENKKEAA